MRIACRNFITKKDVGTPIIINDCLTDQNEFVRPNNGDWFQHPNFGEGLLYVLGHIITHKTVGDRTEADVLILVITPQQTVDLRQEQRAPRYAMLKDAERQTEKANLNLQGLLNETVEEKRRDSLARGYTGDPCSNCGAFTLKQLQRATTKIPYTKCDTCGDEIARLPDGY